MILGDTETANNSSRDLSLTLDDVFRRHARRRPDALALVDAANRATFAGGNPKRLTYAEADRMVSAIAGRLRDMGLPTDTVVAIHLPNIVENLLAALAVLRAGMIVAALPLLSRRGDAAAALARIGAKAIITCDRVGAFDQVQCAMGVAADVFSIRYVCGFGEDLPDGVVSFTDLFTAQTPDQAPAQDDRTRSDAAAHIAAITFDGGEGGVVPVARSHAELLAGGLAVLLESAIAQDAVIQSTLNPSSFAGICLTLVPWLLCGGTLVLHHPFDAQALAQQMRDEQCTTLILPEAVAFRLAAAGVFAEARPASIIATWRAPERLATSPTWHVSGVTLIDVALFGEAVLIPSRRRRGGPDTARPVARAARRSRRNRCCGSKPHRCRHTRRTRSHGAATRLPARR
jgi:non-ribosomal peptide synthetase component E (peptide arylation enzyme)